MKKTSQTAVAASLSNAETALLGLLAESPKHAYQIEKDVAYREMRVWTDLSMSSIYKLLRKLEVDGLVAAQTETTGANRLRKTYCLSAKGKKALMESVKAILSKPEIVKHPFHVGIYNHSVLPHAVTRRCLIAYRKELAGHVECYGKLEKFLREQECGPWHIAVATRSKRMFEAELGWLDEYLTQLEAMIEKEKR